jgi:stress-induced morphogen
MSTLITQISIALKEHFMPTQLIIEDESEDHLGHGATGAHLHVTISSTQLSQCPPLEAHRQIYSALKPWLLTEIHALRITIV